MKLKDLRQHLGVATNLGKIKNKEIEKNCKKIANRTYNDYSESVDEGK